MKTVHLLGNSRVITTHSQGRWLPNVFLIGLCLPFIFSGVTKLVDFQQAVIEYEKLGIVLPTFAVALTILIQLTGAAMLLFGKGLWSVAGGAQLAVFTVVATIIGHAFWNFDGAIQTAQFNIFIEHLAIACGLLLGAWWRRNLTWID